MANYNKSFNFRNGVQVDNDNFIVNANGLVGIGTSIPREFLDVYGTAKVTGLVTTTNLYVSGFTTVSNLKIGNVSISSGIISATTGIVTYYGDGSKLLSVPTSQWIDVDPSLYSVRSIYAAGNVGVATTNPSYTFQVGGNTVTSNGVGFNSTGDVYISGIITATTASITNTTTTNLTSTASTTTSLRVSGTGTIATLNAVTGVVTTISGTTLTYSGTGSLDTLNANTGIVTTISGTTATYTTANITTLNSTITGSIAKLTNTNLTSTASTITYLNNTDLRTTGVATIQTLKTVDGDIAYFTGQTISVSGNIRSNTLNSNSGIVTTLSGTTLTYSGTGSIGTLNANTGIVTTISGTTATYDTGNITTLSSTITGTITNLTSTNIDAAGIITATNGFRGALTGTASSATQLVTPRNFSITGNFVTASALSFDGTGNVALAATIAPNSIVLGTYTSGNYVKLISGTDDQIIIDGPAQPGGQPQIGLTTNVNIVNNLYVGDNIGIGTTAPAYNLDITTGDGSGVGISTLGNITVTGIVSTSQLYVTNTSTLGTVRISSGIVTAASGIVTYYGSFIGNVTGNTTGNVTGIASTALGLSGTPNITVGVITATKLNIGTAGTTITTNNGLVGIGTADPKGILDLVSTTQPFFVPRMTTTQRNAMNLTGISSGAIIFNTTIIEFQGWTGTSWATLGA
jgi:hypothetical protein